MVWVENKSSLFTSDPTKTNKQTNKRNESGWNPADRVCRLNILSFPSGAPPLAPPTDLQQSDEFEDSHVQIRATGDAAAAG